MSSDSAKSIESFAVDAALLDAGKFASKHGQAFLLRALFDGVLQPTPVNERDAYKGTHKIPRLDLLVGNRLQSPEATYAYSLGDLAGPVSVGRASSNRVCIDDVSLSAQHAEIELRDDGELYVTDKGSTNGTAIGDGKLTFGNPTQVPFGKVLVFGSVKLTLLRATQFMDFVRTVTSPD
ncbi:MAG: FHA domain-containing protein [Deltaproteobacteria bacterium]|nr:FHA domain-containing protein [Deltaproteobacteria bacterium]